jgi:hypothetical protein
MNDERLQQLEMKVSRLEEEFHHFKKAFGNHSEEPWWKRTAGMFKDDKVFEAIMREVRKNRRADYAEARAEFDKKGKSKNRMKKHRQK